jgi:hypothetical protein
LNPHLQGTATSLPENAGVKLKLILPSNHGGERLGQRVVDEITARAERG